MKEIEFEQAHSEIGGFWKSLTPKDILEFFKYRNYIQYQCHGDTYPLYQIGYSIAKSLKNEELTADEAVGLANSILSIDDSDELYSLYCYNSFIYFKEALDYYRKINDKTKISVIYSRLGSTFLKLKKYETAIKYLEDAIEISKEINDKSAQGSDIFNLGYVYKSAGNTEKAISYMKDSIIISKELGDLSNEGRRCANLAYLFKEENNIEDAEKYFNDARDAFMKSGDTEGENKVITDLIELYTPLQIEKIDKDSTRKRIEYTKLGVDLAERKKLPGLRIKFLMLLGIAYSQIGVYSLALKYLHECFEYAKKINDPYIIIRSLSPLINIYIATKQYTKAIEILEQTMDLDEISEGHFFIYGQLGFIYYNIKDFERSSQYFERQIKVIEDPSFSNDKLLKKLGIEGNNTLTTQLMLLGEVYTKSKKYDKALSTYEKALKIYEQMESNSDKALCLAHMGEVSLHRNDLSKANDFFKLAIKECEIKNDTKGLIDVYKTIGYIYFGLDMPGNTLEYLNQGLILSKENKLTDKYLELLLKIGEISINTQNYEQSIGYLKEALEQIDKENYRMKRKILKHLGISYFFQGRFNQGLDYLKRALEANEKLDDQEFNGEILRYINEINLKIGNRAQNKKALSDNFDQLDGLSDETKLDRFIFATNFYIEEHDLEKAYSFVNKALDMATKINSYRISEALSYKAQINKRKGNLEDAIEYYDKSLIEFRKANDRRSEAEVLDMLGMVYFAKGDHKRALELVEQSIRISEEIGNNYALIITYDNLGKIFQMGLKNSEKAIESYKKSIKGLFSIGDNISSDDERLRVIEKNIHPFHGIVKTLIDMGDNINALCYAENLKSLNFNKKREKNRVSREKTNLERATSIFNKYGLPSYKYINENLDTTSNEINNDLSDHLSYKFIDEKSFQDHLYNLNIDSNKAIVEYFIMNDCCVIFLIFTADNSIKVSIEVIDDFNFIDLGSLMIKKDAEKYSGYLTSYIFWKEEGDNSKESNTLDNKSFTNFCLEIDKINGILYEKIFAPIKNLLDANNITQIKFVPNNYLYSLPLHAMYKKCGNGDKRYLIEDYDISYVPSLKMLFEKDIKDIEKTNSILLISNPDYTLPSSDYETEKIQSLHNGAIILSHEEASFNNVISEMIKNFNIIHFACHGEYDFNDPMKSSLLLNDNRLKISDIINVLNLKETKLITLSACETGLVKLDVTDEYIGLSGAFLISGAKSIVSSLWEVADFPTSLLMVKFYEEIYKNNLSPDRALAKAQKWLSKELTLQDLISLLESELNKYPDGTTKNFLQTWYRKLNEKCDFSEKPFANPYYWAPFFISETY